MLGLGHKPRCHRPIDAPACTANHTDERA